jgi:carbon monoxide dehydrogenase subunit G
MQPRSGAEVKLEGSYSFDAPPDQVWELLLDPAALQRCIPGIKELRETAPDQYEATLSVGVAAIKGTYRGTVSIQDRQEPTSYTMVVQGSGGPGFVKGTARITLSPAGNATTVAVDADGQIGGPVAGVGQRMLGGVGKMLMNQFFECMRQQIGSRV